MIDQAIAESLKAHAGAGFLAIALAATQALATEMPFTVDPRTGLPTGLPATLFAHYTGTYRWLGAPQCASRCRSPVARPYNP